MPPPAKNPALAIGLMSGTSVDGVDGVLVEVSTTDTTHQISLLATHREEFPPALQTALTECITQARPTLDELGRIHHQLGVLYARTAAHLQTHAKKLGNRTISVIGCHGQTIRHHPEGEFPFTLQLGDGALIAQRCRLPVVNDFRSADMALGGQGAPLASAFHRAIFANPTEHRAILNLGGIANITHLPATDPSASEESTPPILGFDTGPANTLLDAWCARHFNQPYDRDGALAARGTTHPKLLARMRTDPYFALPPPKSTGREHFNWNWLERMLAAEREFADITPTDTLTTLTELTATTIADALQKLLPRQQGHQSAQKVYICGGGIHNQTLQKMLAANCQPTCELHSTAELGVDPQWVEASAFAWMAVQTTRRIPSTEPQVTGARKPTIAGAIYFPD